MIVDSRRHRRDGAEDHGRMVRIMKKDGNRLEGIGERIAVRLTLAHRLGKGDDGEISDV